MDETRYFKVTNSTYNDASCGDDIKIGYIFTDFKVQPMHAGENWYSGKFWKIEERVVGVARTKMMTFIGSRIWADGEILYEPISDSDLPVVRNYE